MEDQVSAALLAIGRREPTVALRLAMFSRRGSMTPRARQVAAATDPSEGGIQLRQGAPFIGFLSQEERPDFMAA